MSDESKTPETSAEMFSSKDQDGLAKLCARLEKERDDARACLKDAIALARVDGSNDVNMTTDEFAAMVKRWEKAAGLTVGEKSG